MIDVIKAFFTFLSVQFLALVEHTILNPSSKLFALKSYSVRQPSTVPRKSVLVATSTMGASGFFVLISFLKSLRRSKESLLFTAAHSMKHYASL